jgi:hypothetical protein
MCVLEARPESMHHAASIMHVYLHRATLNNAAAATLDRASFLIEQIAAARHYLSWTDFELS